jgi:hypothetical protein
MPAATSAGCLPRPEFRRYMRSGARSARVIRQFDVVSQRCSSGLAGFVPGSSIREIAKYLDRTVSTVGREVARHGGRYVYRAALSGSHDLPFRQRRYNSSPAIRANSASRARPSDRDGVLRQINRLSFPLAYISDR